MAGLGVGPNPLYKMAFEGTPISKPRESMNRRAGYDVGGWNSLPESEQQKYRAGGGAPGMDTGPSGSMGRGGGYGRGGRWGGPPRPRPNTNMGGGINIGPGSIQNILPNPLSPFRTYGTVQNGRVVPPSNPYAPPPNLPRGGAGTWEGGGPGPINTAPQTPPWFQPPTGGFTGGQMPPDMGMGSSAASAGIKPGVPTRDRTAPYMPQIIPGGNPYGQIGDTFLPPYGGGGKTPFGYYEPPASIPQTPGNQFGQRQRFNRGLRGAYGGNFENNLFY